MAAKILVHGSGHKAASWNKTISYMTNNGDIMYLSQNIKNAELKVIENTGHVVNEESPEVLAKILTKYYSLND